MFCENCGKQMRPNAKFCIECGIQVDSQVEHHPNHQTHPNHNKPANEAIRSPNPQKPPLPKKRRNPYTIIIAIVTPVFLVILAVASMFIARIRYDSNVTDNATSQENAYQVDETYPSDEYDQAQVYDTSEPSIQASDAWTVILEPTFDYITHFADGMAAVRIGDWDTGVHGIIDTEGNFVIPPVFEDIGNRYQFYAEDPSINFFTVRQGGYWGLLDRNGNEIIPFEYNEISVFENSNIVRLMIGMWPYSTYSLIDINTLEEIAPMTYSFINMPQYGLMMVRESGTPIEDDYGNYIGIEGNSGFMDEAGQMVIPATFGSAMDFTFGMSVVSQASGWDNDTWGVIDTSGQEIIPLIYSDVRILSPYAIIARDGDWETGAWGMFDQNGNEVIPFSYSNIFYLPDESLVIVTTGTWDEQEVGLRNKFSGEEVIPVGTYESIVVIGEQAIVGMGEWRVNRTEGIINHSTGEVLVDLGHYSFIQIPMHGNLSVIGVGHGIYQRHGLMNVTTGQVILEPVYDQVLTLSDDLVAVRLGGDWEYHHQWSNYQVTGGLWGIFNSQGQEVVPIQFDALRAFSPGLHAVAFAEEGIYVDPSGIDGWYQPFVGKWGLINDIGEIVLPMEYDFISWAINNMMLVNQGGDWISSEYQSATMLGGRWGIVDSHGNLIVPAELAFDFIMPISDDMVAVQQDGLWGLVRID